jgi:HK97 family phage prohead protease
MQKAFTILEIKAVQDGKKRSFSGIATTPAADRMEDIVEPLGAKFKLPIPLLWQHDGKDPVGWVTSAQVTDKGILIDGEIADIPDTGKLKERLAEAWQMIKSGLVRGLSIGFRPIESEPIRGTGGQRFTLWEWLELSAVTIPANLEASILSVKQFSADPAPTKKAGQGAVKLYPASYRW